MSWTSCMEKKIEDKYGDDVKTCIEGISKHNLDKVAACIADVLRSGDPDSIAAHLAVYAAECEF